MLVGLDKPAEAKLERIGDAFWWTSTGYDGKKQTDGPHVSESEAAACLLCMLMENADNDMPDARRCIQRVIALSRQHYPRFEKYRLEALRWVPGANEPPEGWDELFEENPGELPPLEDD